MNACVSTEGYGARAGTSRQCWEGPLLSVEAPQSIQGIGTFKQTCSD